MGVFALALLLGAAGAVAAWLTSRKLLAERSELRRVRALFSRYVPIQVVDDLLARKDPRLFQHRRDFAIVGNPAHVAERLHLAADELNATIVASATTYEAVRELFVGISASSIPLRGLKRLQNAYIKLPSEKYFKQTKIRFDEVPEAVEAPVAAEYFSPDAVETQPGARPRDQTEYTTFSAHDDDRPAMPAPPALAGTYEDDDGPPVPLPP